MHDDVIHTASVQRIVTVNRSDVTVSALHVKRVAVVSKPSVSVSFFPSAYPSISGVLLVLLCGVFVGVVSKEHFVLWVTIWRVAARMHTRCFPSLVA